jgi:hypothetical protein
MYKWRKKTRFLTSLHERALLFDHQPVPDPDFVFQTILFTRV